MTRQGFYSRDTTESLRRMFGNLAPKPLPNFAEGGMAGWDTVTGQAQESARRRRIIGEELAWRDANPGQYERDMDARARMKAMFGW